MHPSSETTLSTSDVAVRVLTEGIGNRNVGVIERFVAEDYIQHSENAGDGRAGLVSFVTQAPDIGVHIHRVLEDGDKVALHVSYTFPDGRSLVAFDVFRVQNGQLVEHWDALQSEVPASETVSGRSMVDGPTEVVDLHLTEGKRVN